MANINEMYNGNNQFENGQIATSENNRTDETDEKERETKRYEKKKKLSGKN